MNRRELLRLSLATMSLGPVLTRAAVAAAELPDAIPSKLPRWRGFNLLDKFNGQNKPFMEKDFAEIAELGFNFVRLPMDYRMWTDGNDLRKLREPVLKEIDAAVEFGEKHGIHVQPNFHRAPGYTVASPPEAKSLWTDVEILDVCAFHWSAFARRYKGIPNRNVSFNLLNEPNSEVKPEDHRRVVETLAKAIRREDPDRLIVCDGRSWGNKPPTELLGLNVAAAAHDYQPAALTHYKASWANWNDSWPKPTWPLVENDGKVIGRDAIVHDLIKPWKELEGRGMGVMVGEFGCHNMTPHRFVLSWMNDVLAEFRAAGWGWALWNWNGSFGIIDSGRKDVAYDTWHGRKLDRGMLELLRQY